MHVATGRTPAGPMGHGRRPAEVPDVKANRGAADGRHVLALIVTGVCFAAAGIGSIAVNQTLRTWYTELHKPTGTRPTGFLARSGQRSTRRWRLRPGSSGETERERPAHASIRLVWSPARAQYLSPVFSSASLALLEWRSSRTPRSILISLTARAASPATLNPDSGGSIRERRVASRGDCRPRNALSSGARP